ncbi:hypothetical protein C8J57DRAFT_1529163 [Mycena rebaudengoi]|nr:hypothetical protein C8J57DRAFT_1529163 [Mycena rebaudengoi]
MTTIAIVFTLLLVFVVYGTRALLRRVFSVLDNVPGPLPKSLLTGNLCILFFGRGGHPFTLGLLAGFSGTFADHPFKEELVDAVVVAAKLRSPSTF